MEEIGAERYDEVTEKVAVLNQECEEKQKQLGDLNILIDEKSTNLNKLEQDIEKKQKQLDSKEKQINKVKSIYASITYCIDNFLNYSPSIEELKLQPEDDLIVDELSPNVMLKLHHMDVKSLKKEFKNNQKNIDTLLSEYQGRYTTKTNKSIYSLMTIGLSAELQNVLFNLRFEKIDTAKEEIKAIIQKYLAIASNGNQNIVGTITKFVGQLENLYLNAVEIEYNYYVKKEQARQEQLSLRQKMKEEAEERKALEVEKKKIEAEETKYYQEIDRVNELLLKETNIDEIEKLKAQIEKLKLDLEKVEEKKEEISKLQNGKAGNIYIISNEGSFGKNVFKIGMTRRLDPQDRVNELGSASVPFKFDVHSFIFSNDAVALENELHKRLHNQRVNKVNLRKEFFYSNVDELEELVQSIDETAEFNKTMLAEEFHQSLSSDEVYDSTEITTLDEDDE
ncbi:GIY-YIG nuclease family protein [Filifactor alocis]|uniref:GIY-YIG nuclease family protein n=1 Tax=Filifactor alocis TaxID=143361 RepID=UPI003FA0D139